MTRDRKRLERDGESERERERERESPEVCQVIPIIVYQIAF